MPVLCAGGRKTGDSGKRTGSCSYCTGPFLAQWCWNSTPCNHSNPNFDPGLATCARRSPFCRPQVGPQPPSTGGVPQRARRTKLDKACSLTGVVDDIVCAITGQYCLVVCLPFRAVSEICTTVDTLHIPPTKHSQLISVALLVQGWT